MIESTVPPPGMRAAANAEALAVSAFAAARPFRFDTAALSDVGRVRKENEDSFIVHADAGLWCVADGMGGYEAGKFASSSVADALATVGQAASAADLLARFQDRLAHANDAMRAAGRAQGLGTFGTTVVALLIHERHFACVWSGDSRCYRLRGERLEQISRDHTEVQDLVDRGMLTPEEARRWPGRNVITRAIGVSDEPDTEVVQGDVEQGDVFVLCSDGLTGHVDDGEIRTCVVTLEPEEACARLIEMTLARGASDNVTVIVLACRSSEGAIPVRTTNEA